LVSAVIANPVAAPCEAASSPQNSGKPGSKSMRGNDGGVGSRGRLLVTESPLTRLLNGGTFNCVKITFDPAQRQAALNERGLNFTDALVVFAGPTITVQDTRRDYGEARFQTVGFLADRMVMVVWTPRNEARHVISMRKCNAREKAIASPGWNMTKLPN
jgi:uncharacterized DUF497 family protein